MAIYNNRDAVTGWHSLRSLFLWTG